ncbi:MAG: hypothetical protein SFV17_15430 [Candidatus Obscuribacter sp.]|nr:hypothetical protein [Candidatus Obscuribacter sp.]
MLTRSRIKAILKLSTGILSGAAASSSALLIIYMVVWYFQYRLPAAPPRLIDLRSDSGEKPYYVCLCAALADNPHGFPGHSYVAFSRSLPCNLIEADSIGRVPCRFQDQASALFQPVPGMIMNKAAPGNLRNFNALVAVVDENTYQRCLARVSLWQDCPFQVGKSDCVAFTNSIAAVLNLKLPSQRLVYPQDYVKELKDLNCTSRTTQTIHCTYGTLTAEPSQQISTLQVRRRFTEDRPFFYPGILRTNLNL